MKYSIVPAMWREIGEEYLYLLGMFLIMTVVLVSISGAAAAAAAAACVPAASPATSGGSLNRNRASHPPFRPFQFPLLPAPFWVCFTGAVAVDGEDGDMTTLLPDLLLRSWLVPAPPPLD